MTKLIHLFSKNNSGFIDNSPSSFLVSLDSKILCPKGSELALIEASFFSALQVDDTKAFLTVYNWQSKRKNNLYGRKTTFHLQKEEFTSPDQLCSLLNSFLWDCISSLKESRTPFFKYYESQDRIWILIDSSLYFTVKLGGKILQLLGCQNKPVKPTSFVVIGKSLTGDSSYVFNGEKRFFHPDLKIKLKSTTQKTNFFQFSPSIHPALHCLVIYSNIVCNSKVNETQAPILRVVPFKQQSKKKELINLDFSNNLQFIPIKPTEIQLIGIQIRDLEGHLAPLVDFSRITLALSLPPSSAEMAC